MWPECFRTAEFECSCCQRTPEQSVPQTRLEIVSLSALASGSIGVKGQIVNAPTI